MRVIVIIITTIVVVVVKMCIHLSLYIHIFRSLSLVSIFRIILVGIYLIESCIELCKHKVRMHSSVRFLEKEKERKRVEEFDPLLRWSTHNAYKLSYLLLFTL